MFFLVYYVLTKRNNTFKLGVSRALKQRSQQPKAGAVSWPIPVTLKLQWSAIHVSCPLGGLRTKCLKDRSILNAATQCFQPGSDQINQAALGWYTHPSCSWETKQCWILILRSPLPHKAPHPPQLVLQPNRQLRCSYTPLLSMRVGLGATAVEPRVALVSPHSSPLQRGRVRWLVTRQFLSAIRIWTCQEFETHLGVRIVGLGNARLLEATFPLQQVFFWSVHLPNKPALSFRFLYFGGGEREDMKKRYWGWGWGVVCVAYCSYYLLAFLPLSREGKS